jgi:hypothetical protein
MVELCEDRAMSVEVKYHSMSAPTLRALGKRLLSQPPHDPRMLAVFREDIVNWFNKYHGFPPGTRYCKQFDPEQYVARYSSDVWVYFVAKPLGTQAPKKIIITGFADSPPPS